MPIWWWIATAHLIQAMIYAGLAAGTICLLDNKWITRIAIAIGAMVEIALIAVGIWMTAVALEWN